MLKEAIGYATSRPCLFIECGETNCLVWKLCRSVCSVAIEDKSCTNLTSADLWFLEPLLFLDFFLLLKSLKSRGIRFPGRDNDSLVPIFTPPRSVSAPEVDASLTHQIQYDIPLQSLTAEQTKEAFDVARNSVELLTTVLSSSPQQDALQVLIYNFSISNYFLVEVGICLHERHRRAFWKGKKVFSFFLARGA